MRQLRDDDDTHLILDGEVRVYRRGLIGLRQDWLSVDFVFVVFDPAQQ